MSTATIHNLTISVEYDRSTLLEDDEAFTILFEDFDVEFSNWLDGTTGSVQVECKWWGHCELDVSILDEISIEDFAKIAHACNEIRQDAEAFHAAVEWASSEWEYPSYERWRLCRSNNRAREMAQQWKRALNQKWFALTEAECAFCQLEINEAQRRQDRSGYVYLIKSVTGHYKIGRTKNPNDRMATFSVKLPFEIEYDHLIQTDDMCTLEDNLHGRFADCRVGGEWFNLTPDDVAFIKSLRGVCK